jgi:hypothetical protein
MTASVTQEPQKGRSKNVDETCPAAQATDEGRARGEKRHTAQSSEEFRQRALRRRASRMSGRE